MSKSFINIFCALMFPIFTWAHEIRPGYLEIKEKADHSLQITWKQPTFGEYSIPLSPAITAGWLNDSLATISYAESYLIKRWQIPVIHEDLNEQIIKIDGLEKTMTDVLVQVTLLNDASFTYLV